MIACRSALTPCEAYQCGFHIVKQGRPRTSPGLRARNEYIIGSSPSVEGQKHTGGCAQTSLGAIAHHRIADFLCCGEARPGGTFPIILTRTHLDHNGRLGNARCFARTQKIAPLGYPRGAIRVFSLVDCRRN